MEKCLSRLTVVSDGFPTCRTYFSTSCINIDPKASFKICLTAPYGRPSCLLTSLLHTTHFFHSEINFYRKTQEDKQHEKYNLNLPRHSYSGDHTLFVQRSHASSRKMPSCSPVKYVRLSVRAGSGGGD